MKREFASPMEVLGNYDWLLLYGWVLAVFAWQVHSPVTGLTVVGVMGPVMLYLYYGIKEQPIVYLRLTFQQLPTGVFWGVVIGGVGSVISLAKAHYLGSGVLYTAWVWEEWTSLVLSAAIVEEVFFRGMMLRRLMNRVNFSKANAITAVLFTLSHSFIWWSSNLSWVEWISHSSYVLVFGGVLGYVFKASQSLWTPIVVHGLNNTVALLTIGICY